MENPRLFMWVSFILGCVVVSTGLELMNQYIIAIGQGILFFLPCVLRFGYSFPSRFATFLLSGLITILCILSAFFLNFEWTLPIWVVANPYVLVPDESNNLSNFTISTYTKGFYLLTCISTLGLLAVKTLWDFGSFIYIAIPVMCNSLVAIQLFRKRRRNYELSTVNLAIVTVLVIYWIREMYWEDLCPSGMFFILFFISCGWVIHDINRLLRTQDD